MWCISWQIANQDFPTSSLEKVEKISVEKMNASSEFEKLSNCARLNVSAIEGPAGRDVVAQRNLTV